MKRIIPTLLILVLAAPSCSSSDQGTTKPTGPATSQTSATGDGSTEVPSTDTGTSGGTGTQPSATASTVGALTADDLFLPDPTVGLAGLTSYHQEMILTVTGSAADTTDTYVRDSWAGIGTSTAITLTTPTGVTELLVGDLGQTSYVRSGTGAACTVRWNEAGTPAAPPVEPAAMLPRVVTASQTGTEVREGVPATGYRFDAQVGGASGSGELWLADDSGTMLSYSLDLADGATTQQYRYAVSSINALGEATLPAGCTPVLDSIPAIDGATNLQRLTNGLDYSTTAAVADVVAFYEQTMPSLGWALVGTRADDPARPTMFFANATTQQAASIFVEIADGSTWVSVIVRAAATTTG